MGFQFNIVKDAAPASAGRGETAALIEALLAVATPGESFRVYEDVKSGKASALTSAFKALDRAEKFAAIGVTPKVVQAQATDEKGQPKTDSDGGKLYNLWVVFNASEARVPVSA
jgi:hypothetical protein